jgi:AcrR family transcriptional regulator
MQVSERRQQLRDRLVEAAERIIAGQGLSGLKARDLAQEAGCAVGAIYTVFSDLDALVLEVNMRTLALFESYIVRATASGEEDDIGQARPAMDSAPDATERALLGLVRLARAYLTFAQDHPLRWRTLFQHRLPGGQSPPDWYLAEQSRLFRYIEAPLALLCPGLADDERLLRARSLFSSTHGLVSLGLDEKLMALPGPLLARELEVIVRALGRGLAQNPTPCP